MRHSGQPILYNGDKLQTLVLAKEVGLDIPPTLVTTEKIKVKTFKAKQGDIITKTIDIQFHLNEVKQNETYMLYINNFSDERIDSLPDTFFPALFQKQIEKKYELRIFYVADKFFPVAIFSQTNDKTNIDFRHYDRNKPNRNVPYLLPPDLEKKT